MMVLPNVNNNDVASSSRNHQNVRYWPSLRALGYVAKYLRLTGKNVGDWHTEWETPIKIEYDRALYSKYVSLYEQELRWLSDLYHKLEHKELVWSEDYMRNTKEQKYNRPIVWDRTPDHCNIDVEEFFPGLIQ